MSGHRLFKLKWKKKDRNIKGPFPYSFFHKEDYLKSETFRNPDGYPMLIPSLKDRSNIAKRYRDQVKKTEIEDISFSHLKMLAFRKTENTEKRHEIKTEEQKFNSLPYWLFATRSKLLRGLPLTVQEMANSLSNESTGLIEDTVHNAVREFLLPNSNFREKFDDRTNKHFNSFLKSVAFSIAHCSELQDQQSSEKIFNQDVETVGLFGKENKIYQVHDNATTAQIRSTNPLVPYESLDAELCKYRKFSYNEEKDSVVNTEEIPRIPHNMEHYEVFVWENKKVRQPPRSKQWLKERITVKPLIKKAHIFSGVKPGTIYPYHHTQFLLVPRVDEFWREPSAFHHQEVTDCKTLLNMHSTLTSTAWYLNYTPFQDLTSPLCLNALTYDGTQNVAFYNYQLNTVATGKHMLEKFDPEEMNSRCNLLWSTELTPLFSYDEEKDSVDINTEAVKYLVTLLTSKTEARQFDLPVSSWDPRIPEGIPLVRIDRDVDPGKIWIKPKQRKNWPKKYNFIPKLYWNPEYMEMLKNDPDQRPFYDATEDHSEFIKKFNNKKNFLK